ncbi:MAG: hypothetical protein H7228_00165 [Polaromonas sp.]|nr:hypothetical protein [Polaromonas sp.]
MTGKLKLRMKLDLKDKTPIAVLLLAVVLSVIFLGACSKREAVTGKTFVGKWQSSKLVTPLYLYENGEWEIKKDDGAVLQYGTWEYKDDQILWSFKVDSAVGHDVNPVLVATSKQFQLKESDQTITSFAKLP